MKKILLSISLLACSSLVSAQMTAEDLKEKDTEVAASLQQFAKKKGISAPLDYQHAYYDLNNDNKLDAIALLKGPDWCTADGCTMAVMIADKIGFDFMGTTKGVNAPIGVDPDSKRYGYVSFILNTKKNGAVKMRYEQLAYPKSPDNSPKASENEQTRKVVLIK